jgi:hypothetical protein
LLEENVEPKGRGDALEKLLEQVNNDGESADMKECVKVLMKYETNIHAWEGFEGKEKGYTPLELAIKSNFRESVKLMVLQTQKPLDCRR